MPWLMFACGLIGLSLGMVVAQSGAPSIEATGWVGAGILGLVLFWIFYVHLPAKDKQLAELVNRSDTRLDALVDRFDKTLIAQRLDLLGVIESIRTDDAKALADMKATYIASLERLERRSDEQHKQLQEQHEAILSRVGAS